MITVIDGALIVTNIVGLACLLGAIVQLPKQNYDGAALFAAVGCLILIGAHNLA